MFDIHQGPRKLSGWVDSDRGKICFRIMGPRTHLYTATAGAGWILYRNPPDGHVYSVDALIRGLGEPDGLREEWTKLARHWVLYRIRNVLPWEEWESEVRSHSGIGVEDPILQDAMILREMALEGDTKARDMFIEILGDVSAEILAAYLRESGHRLPSRFG